MPPATPSSLPTPVSDASALALLAPFALVADDLALVERELEANGHSGVAAITEIADYLRQSGGKRIRPALVLLAARLSECEAPARIRLAAVVEMIHAATLVHDDIIDEAPQRRGRASTNACWGNAKCVLAGDWLYMQSFAVALRERNFAILDALISLTQNMVEGELIQLEMQGRVPAAAEHVRLMTSKTARLFEVASQLGSLAAGRPPEWSAALGRFGRHLGLAFQMVDDILDFTADAEVLGKPVGNDLREGKMTLPAIYAHEAGSPAERAELAAVLADRGYERVPFAAIQSLLTRTGALARARQQASAHAHEAQAALAGFADSPWRAALLALPELVLARNN